MHTIALEGCTSTPFGNYLKALGILRLVAEQADPEARGIWDGDSFSLSSALDEDALVAFFLDEYRPTPILAPWNGGSGFYPKDNKDGLNAILKTSGDRFRLYRESIHICGDIDEVKQGKVKDEDERRTAILRHCRNRLPDVAVEWLDAAVGIAADGGRSFAPVLGTGGNEGRLDYTNNFMSRIAALLISPPKTTPVRELLENALFAHRTTALQAGAAGQYDPGRAGGANQGQGISHDSATNPWDLVLTLEGAVSWASGLYRRQGTSYGSVLCSPFTVRPSKVGYGSSSSGEDARAEVWAPIWSRPVAYREMKTLLREGRASVDGRAAKNGIEFAEAASSLGVDRGIDRFVRYSLLKRRGDSYVALPAGTFATGYRSEADLVRKFQTFFETLLQRDLPTGADDLRRSVESAVFNVLLKGKKERVRELMAALGRMLRRIVTSSDMRLPLSKLKAAEWLDACDFQCVPEVRIAAALASIFTRDVGSVSDNLSRADKRFAWIGSGLPGRLISVLDRRLQIGAAVHCETNPVGAACLAQPGDTTLFIERTVDDALIEDLLFAFATLDWKEFRNSHVKGKVSPNTEVLPVYAVLKHLFLPSEITVGEESKRIRADPTILSLLESGRISEAAAIAVHRLQIAGLRPLKATYAGGVDATRLAAALLIPVWPGKALSAGILKREEKEQYEFEIA